MTAPTNNLSKSRPALWFAWGMMLAVSQLPDAILHEAGIGIPPWLFWAKMGVLGAALLAGFLWPAARPLRAFALLGVLYLSEWLLARIKDTTFWRGLFGGPEADFIPMMFSTQLVRLAVALLMLAALFILFRRREAFFFVRGDLDANAAPVRFLINPGTRWKKLGAWLCVFLTLGTLTFLMLAGHPSIAALQAALPMLPTVLLFSAMNAFSEELSYRAGLLAVLEGPLGAHHALWLTAAFFGIGHYFGVPYGIIGVLLAGFLGWLLGKSMLETRGFFWAWFIHFWQDVAIFAFMAVGAVTAGGG